MGTKYSTVTVTSYNASPPADDGSQAASNQITWAKHKTKLGDPLKTAIEAIDTNLVAALNTEALQKTDTYTVAAAEHKKTLEFLVTSAGADVILLDAATAAAGFIVNVSNSPTSTANIRVKLATAADLLNSKTNGTITIPPDASAAFIVNPSANGYVIHSAHGLTISSTGAVHLDAGGVTSTGTVILSVQDENGTVALVSEFTFSNLHGSNGRLLFPKGYISGMDMSNHTDADHDISIAAGVAADSTGTENLILTSALVKQIDAAWAVGSNQGGMDTGTVSEGSWYYVWAIKRTDTGVVDALFSLSKTAPTMPTNYTISRRIGAVKTDASANIIAFKQKENDFWWVDAPQDFSGASSTGAVPVTLSVPPIAGIVAKIRVNGAGGGSTATVHFKVYATDDTDSAPSSTDNDISIEGVSGTVFGYAANDLEVRVDGSGQVNHRATATTHTKNIWTKGWKDTRR